MTVRLGIRSAKDTPRKAVLRWGMVPTLAVRTSAVQPAVVLSGTPGISEYTRPGRTFPIESHRTESPGGQIAAEQPPKTAYGGVRRQGFP